MLSDFKDPETGNCVVMSRRVFIDQLPPVLLIQLNRFFYSTPGDKNCDQFAIHKVLKQIPIHKKLKIAEGNYACQFGMETTFVLFVQACKF